MTGPRAKTLYQYTLSDGTKIRVAQSGEAVVTLEMMNADGALLRKIYLKVPPSAPKMGRTDKKARTDSPA